MGKVTGDAGLHARPGPLAPTTQQTLTKVPQALLLPNRVQSSQIVKVPYMGVALVVLQRQIDNGNFPWIPQRLIQCRLTGWGAHFQHAHAQESWSPQEARLSINLLELRAIHLALSLCLFPGGFHVLVMTDNISVNAYVNHWGGERTKSRNLALEASRLFLWMEANLISL